MDQVRLDALLETMSPLEDVSPWLRILLYGEAGVGKTVLACNYGENILHVDSFDGWVSLKNHPEIMKKVTKRMQYEGRSQLEMLCEAIEEGILSYDTIVLDEASSMSIADLDVVLRTRAAKDSKKDPDVPTQPDYGANTERMRRTFSRLLKLPCNIILVAHVREDKDESTGVRYIRPAFMPKMRQTIEQLCTVVCHLTANEIANDDGITYVRKLQLQPTRSITAKNRVGGLPPVVENPDFNVMFAEWQAHVIEDTSPVEVPKEPDAPVLEIDSSDESISIGE